MLAGKELNIKSCRNVVQGTYIQWNYWWILRSHGSRVSETGEANFQIGAVVINKPQIWVLNYILALNTLKTIHDTITNILKIMRINGGWNTMQREPISMFSAQVPPPIVPDLRKSTSSQAGTFWWANSYLELYLDPGSCGGDTPSTGTKSLVPGEVSTVETSFTCHYFLLWGLLNNRLSIFVF